ncbi:interleukin 17-like protein [Octopus sinensis]|uniref:Interleukin 17-like protein n=1 Tax=Octopus sinensis TaxID=2607531 RepID=A0A7E6FDM2_9MOLL|nr:interleukin 17-like protein [Octopus sinensis]
MKKYYSLEVLSSIVIFLFNIAFLVSSASIPDQCKIPANLKVQYQTLSRAAIGNNFLLPVERAPVGSKQNSQTDGDKTCPTSPSSSDIIRERSTCPWYLNITHDSTVFPPSRTEAVCRCNGCFDSDNNHECVMVYTPMTVLKRTDECVDGLYVYKPKVIEVATACACARKADSRKGGSNDEYES